MGNGRGGAAARAGENAYSVEKPTAVEGTGKPWKN